MTSEYRRYHVGAVDEFPFCHPDSPRKRAGELAEMGLLDVVDHRKGLYGSPESVYRLSPDGRHLLGRQS